MIKTALKYIKNILNRFSKALIWLISITFAVLILIQITIAGSVLWLNSDSGQDFIKTKITTATQETGYTINFTKISYAFPQGFSIHDFKISDDGGPIADMDRIILRPNLIGLGIRNFGLSINADTLTLHRRPETKEETAKPDEPFKLKPFSLPDIYFRSFSLDTLSVKTLEIKEPLFGIPLTLSPKLSSRIALGDIIKLNLDMDLQRSGENVLPVWLPEKIALKGDFDPKSLNANLENLIIRNEQFNFNAAGSANLNENITLDLKANANVNDFAPLTNGIKGKAEMTASVKGPLETLSIQSNGSISMPLLSKHGLDDITFEISDDNISTEPLGVATLKTTYQDMPVTLAASFNKNDNIILIQSIQGDAPDLSINGQIALDSNTMRANGTLDINAPNLTTYSALADINLKGKASANITLSDAQNAQGVDIDTILTQIVYDTITLKKAALSAKILDIKNPWPDTLKLSATDLRPANDVLIRSINTTVTQKQDETHALTITANGKAFNDFTLNGGATLKGIKQSQISADNIDLKLTSQGSAITVQGNANMQTLDVTLKTKGFNLGNLPVALPEQLKDLALNANVNASGPMNAPVIKGDVGLTPITVLKDSKIKISATALYNQNVARIDLNGTGDAIKTMNGYAQIPLTLSLYPFALDLPKTTNIEGQLDLAANAKAIGALILPVGQRLNGDIALNAKIAGTIANPDITGTGTLNNGTYMFDAYGVELFDIDLSADLTPDTLQLKTLSANDGKGGQLSGDGRMSFKNQQNTKLDLKITDFKLLDSDKAEGTLSADLDMLGQAEGYLLSGNINLGQFDIIIPERFNSKIPELNIVEKGNNENQKEQLNTINLDLRVKADDRIFVRGWGLDAEFGGNIKVDGTLADPQLNGFFQSKRGRYEEFGRRFTLERAYLRFQGSTPPSPYLDIVATTDADEIQASVNLSGAVGDPSIKLSSVPTLPEDEVMSHILFGKNLTRITPFQAIQLKQTLDRFSGNGGGGFDPLGKLRDLTGLDDIRVDTDDEGEASVGVGKYLTEDVYLELEKGAGEQSGAAKIQVELAPNINLESEVGQDAQAGAGVTWKWDY